MAYDIQPGFGATTPPANDTFADGVVLSMGLKPGTEAYKTAKAGIIWSGQQLNDAVETLQNTRAGKIVVAGSDLVSAADDMVANAIDGKYKADASGVVNIAKDTKQFLTAFQTLGERIGGSAGAAVAEIAAWGQFAAGCAGGIAAASVVPGWGTAAAAAGCALGFLVKIFGVFSPTAAYSAPNTQPRTLFKPRNTAMPFIAQDSIRLGQVLTHFYGVRFKTLKSKLDISTFLWFENYPAEPDVAEGQIGSPKKGVPGHNLYTILHMLSGPQTPQHAHDSIDNALLFLAAIRGRARMEGPGAGRRLWMRYIVDNDISVDAIAHGAYIGRSAIARQGTALIKCTIDVRDGSLPHVQNALGLSAINQQRTVLCDFTPFVLLDELLNFFSAVTLREVKSEGVSSFINKYGLGNDLPIANLYVQDGSTSSDRSGQPPQDGGKSPEYNSEPNCRTNLQRVPNECGAWNDYLISVPPPVGVLRETAAVRLCAAFSYIHMQYRWSAGAEAMRKDPTAAIEPINMADPADEMRLPVDPRQILPQSNVTTVGLYKARVYALRVEEKPSSSFLAIELFKRGGINPTSKTSPVIPSPSFAGENGFAAAVTSPAMLKQRIDAREALVQSAIAKARVAAALTPKIIEIAPSFMVPIDTKSIVIRDQKSFLQSTYSKGLLATARMKTPEELAARPGTGAGTGLATPLLVGAAALLALKFIK